jgi:hypothetical protein
MPLIGSIFESKFGKDLWNYQNTAKLNLKIKVNRAMIYRKEMEEIARLNL